ncbi:MAG TPA: GNAT family N-acetyltransferase [Actinomycetota bacterium]|nr:GNAT family N-acetyltransferase [Actinomycetota bacterium]
MDDRALVEAGDESYVHSMRLIAEHLPQGRFIDRGSLLIAESGAPVPYFNVVFVIGPLDDPVSELAAAVSHLDAKGLPFVVRAREGAEPAIGRAASEAGLVEQDPLPGMSLYPLPDDRPPAPSGLRIRRVGTDDYAGFVHTSALGFGAPPDLMSSMFPATLAEAEGTATFLGSEGGEPVATGVLIMTGDVAGVYSISTLPSHRRRGYGEAMTWAAIEEGLRRGARAAVLQASVMGRPVYERMGFRTSALYLTFGR